MIGAMLVLWLIAVIDWQQRRIPNSLLLVLLLLAAIAAWHNPQANAQTVAINLLVGLALSLPGYIRGMVGAGDVKLMVVVSPLWSTMELLIAFAGGITIVLVAMLLRSCTSTHPEHGVGSETTRTMYASGPVPNNLLTSARSGLPLGTAVAAGATLLYIT